MTENSELTPDRKRVLANYIRDMADKMGLRDCQFVINDNQPPNPVLAATESWDKSKTFDIWIHDRFFTHLGPRMQIEVLCHELVHWHLTFLTKFVQLSARQTLGDEALKLFKEGYELQEELVVDAISSAWARMFLPIPWGSDEPLYKGAFHFYHGGKDSSYSDGTPTID